MTLTIKGRLDGLNEYTKACRGNRYGANAMKKRNEQKVKDAAEGLPSVDKYPVKLKITWYEPNKRRDVDNIAFAVKFIQDGLVRCGILENDDQKHLTELEHIFKMDKDNPRVVVEILDAVNI